MSANKIITLVNLHESRIYIVDDNPMNIDIFENLLDEEGFKNITTKTRLVKTIVL